jgi:hypothetical protein
MDPYTDFVGIPTPCRICPECRQDWPVDNRVCPDCSDHPALSKRTLRNIRPINVDEADLIMMDEFPRGSEATLNACFELIQFGTINGEKLPRLKCVWAAMNPTDGGQYKQGDLDPALVDRFDVFIEVLPKPSFNYMVDELGLDMHDVKAILAWWKQHDQEHRGTENYISPRRLVKMLQMYALTDDPFIAVPPGVTLDRNKLKGMLDKAKQSRNKQDVPTGGKLGEGAYTGFDYDPEYIKLNQVPMISYMKDHPDDYDTCQAIINAIESKQGKTLATDYSDVIEYLRPPQLESFLSSMGEGKREAFVTHLENIRKLSGNAYENIQASLDEIAITGS